MKQKLIPFGTFPMRGEELEMMLLTMDEKGEGFVSAELPDAVFGFKSCKISYPNLVILNRKGFDDSEMSWIVGLVNDNMTTILKTGKEGAVNAGL